MGFFGRIIDSVKSSIDSAFDFISRPFRSREDVDEPDDKPIQPKDYSDIEDHIFVDDPLDGDDPTEDEPDDIAIWRFEEDLFVKVGDSDDNKEYIETTYTIYLTDGETIEGEIRFYGDEEDLSDAIIAMNGDIDSEDIAYVYF